MPLVVCTKCGAHGTGKGVNLPRPCPAVFGDAAGAGRRKEPAYRKQASLVQRGRHPSRPGILLHSMVPLRLQPPPLVHPPPPPPPLPGHEGRQGNATTAAAPAGAPSAEEF